MPFHATTFPSAPASPGRLLIHGRGGRGGPRPPGLRAGRRAYPSRPVRIVVPNPPAGSTDIVTRVLAERLTAKLGQNFVVENRPGAGGNISHGSCRAQRAGWLTLGPPPGRNGW